MATELQVPEEIRIRLSEIAESVMAEVEIANDFEVNDPASATLAGEQLQAITRLVKSLDNERLSYTRPYDQLKSDIKGEYDKPTEKLNTAAKALRARLTEYLNEQERIRQDALRAEQQRIERERREAAEKLEAEQARLAKLKSADAIERAQARIEDAAAKVDETSIATAIVPQAAKVAGFGLRDNWVPEYRDGSLDELVKAAAQNPKLLRYLTFETVEINRVVKAMRDGADIPGVTPVNHPISTVR